MRLPKGELESLSVLNHDTASDIIRNPNFFSIYFGSYYDNIRKKLINTVLGQENIFSKVPDNDKQRVFQDISRFLGEDGYPTAGGALHWEVYRPFAYQHGFLQTSEFGEGAIPVTELSGEQRAEWERYLKSIDFLTNKRTLIAKAIYTLVFPSVSTHYKEDNEPLAAELEMAKREIVLNLLPHITDEEARTALGPGYTAERVRQRSMEPNEFTT